MLQSPGAIVLDAVSSSLSITTLALDGGGSPTLSSSYAGEGGVAVRPEGPQFPALRGRRRTCGLSRWVREWRGLPCVSGVLARWSVGDQASHERNRAGEQAGRDYSELEPPVNEFTGRQHCPKHCERDPEEPAEGHPMRSLRCLEVAALEAKGMLRCCY